MKKFELKTAKDKIDFSYAQLRLTIHNNMYTEVAYSNSGKWVTMSTPKNGSAEQKPLHYLKVEGKAVDAFALDAAGVSAKEIVEDFGEGVRLTVVSYDTTSLSCKVKQTLYIDVFDNFPSSATVRANYAFIGATKDLAVETVYANALNLDAKLAGMKNSFDAWVYNGSGETREHHIQALTENYYKKNYLGLLESHDGGGYQPKYRCGSQPGYGGGTPIVNVWTRNMGIAVGHIDLSFRYVSMPITVHNGKSVSINIEYNPRETVNGTREIMSYKTVIIAHDLDYFNAIDTYRAFMKVQGINTEKVNEESYEAQWDTWGFNADFTQEDIKATLPYLREIGIKWLTLDDRWFDVTGDWMPRLDTFPGGEKEFADFIKYLHDEGFKVKLWSIPVEFDGKPNLDEWMKVHPNAKIEVHKHPFHAMSKLFKEHPDWMITDNKGVIEYSKRGNYFASGNVPGVLSYFRTLIKKMFLEWKVDGFKQDAVYMAPQDYNPSHYLSNPDEAGDGYVNIMKVIYETATECNPEAVVLNCPCGTPMTPQWAQYQNQTVTVDPWTSWVNRGVFKEMKGLFGAKAPVVLDHIEISDDGEDFSYIGVGGIPATRFTPSGRDITNEIESRIFDVKPFQEKLDLYKKWFKLYKDMMLSKGEYLNKYDLIYDSPETHVIKKDAKLYFSIYPGEPDGIVDDGGVGYREKKHTKKWSGKFEFRGLDKGKKYRIWDWEHEKEVGTVSGDSPFMELTIDHHLMVELTAI